MTDQLFGFSFSLHKDSSPGMYNKCLAQHILSNVQPDTRLFLQWEIAESLALQNSGFFDATKSKMHIVGPALFKSEDIQLENFDFLSSDNAQHATLKNFLEAASGTSPLEKLNNLLRDGSLFEQFDGPTLHHLTRPRLGELFTEYREIPNATHYPQGLGLHQRVRVNRLILSAVIDDKDRIKPLPYISTQDVLASALSQPMFDAESPIRVIAHPRHADRCVAQVRAELELRQLSTKVVTENINLDAWDPHSAQVWCRNLENWQAYEQKVAELLRSRSLEN